MVFEIGTILETEMESGDYDWYQDPYYEDQWHLCKVNRSWAPDWAKQGVCVYLGSDKKCSIYENRPEVCRDFACRDDAGKLNPRYLRARRHVGHPDKWTEYEKQVFGDLLKERQ
jgi:Fe-S-cluster containining protein